MSAQATQRQTRRPTSSGNPFQPSSGETDARRRTRREEDHETRTGGRARRSRNAGRVTNRRILRIDGIRRIPSVETNRSIRAWLHRSGHIRTRWDQFTGDEVRRCARGQRAIRIAGVSIKIVPIITFFVRIRNAVAAVRQHAVGAAAGSGVVAVVCSFIALLSQRLDYPVTAVRETRILATSVTVGIRLTVIRTRIALLAECSLQDTVAAETKFAQAEMAATVAVT